MSPIPSVTSLSPPVPPLPECHSGNGLATGKDVLLLPSQTLLKGRREIFIQHGDCVYRLRHTSNDKLILTK